MKLAARIVAGIGAFFWIAAFFGLVDLLVVIVNDPDWRQVYLLEAGWGVLFTLLVGVPLVWLTVRPAHGLLVAQLLAVAIAVAIAALWAAYPGQLWVALGLAANAGVVGLLGGLRPAAPPVDRWVRWLVVIGAIGGATFAGAVIDEFPSPSPDVTWGLDHHPMQAALGIAVATVGAVAAVGVGGNRAAARVPVWTLAASVAWLGGWSLAYPALPGSLGTRLGAAALIWSVAFAAVSELRLRSLGRDRSAAAADH